MSEQRTRAHSALIRVLKNFGVLLGGRVVGGVLAFATTLLSARALGASDFGTVSMISAYVLFVRGIVNIKPIEAIVRYGVPLLDTGDFAGLSRLLRLSLCIDIVTSLAGVLLGLVALPLAEYLLHWDAPTKALAAGFLLTLLGSGTATAAGILRLCDRFDVTSATLVVTNALRLAGVAFVVFVTGPSVAGIVWVWALAQLLQYVLTLVMGWQVARRRLPQLSWRGPVSFRNYEKDHSGILRFMNAVYWQTSLDLVPRSLGTLLAGALLGSEGAAMFRVTREFANAMAKPALLVRQAIYPDLARMHHRRDATFTPLILSISLIMAGPALVLTLVSLWYAGPALEFALGSDFRSAGLLMTWFVAAATLELAAAPLRPAAYALNRAAEILQVQLIASIAFLVLFVSLAPTLGLTGPGSATFVMQLVSLGGMSYVVRRALT